MEEQVVIVAGATGLIGNQLIQQMLNERAIDKIYALSRSPLNFESLKLETILDPRLRVLEWNAQKPKPTKGYICLGTTKKQAGSNQALEDIDFQLVCEVANSMKLLGVKHLCVVSSYGANARSRSHYLRCKGRMESALEKMQFEHITFMRPGPLSGQRIIPRKDEVIVQAILKIVRPLMLGPLARLVPIPANMVATTMLYASFDSNAEALQIFDSVDMRNLLKKYQ